MTYEQIGITIWIFVIPSSSFVYNRQRPIILKGPSMAITLLVAAWLTGLLIGFRFDAETWPVFLLALAILPLGLLLYLVRRSSWPAMLVGVLLLGLWRVEITQGAVCPWSSRTASRCP
jgi:hypothetical protein